MAYDIFISYRRSDAAANARLIATSLEKEGYSVFLDYDGIPDGKFDARIYSAIDEAPVFIIILSEGYIERCCEEANWVRWEVEYAIRARRKIVPLHFGGDCPEFPDAVPKEIRDEVGREQCSEIAPPDSQLYTDSIKKMIRNRISPVLEMKRNSETGTGAEIHIETDADCQVLRFHRELIVARKEQENTIWLKKGRHQLPFVSLEDNSVIQPEEYKVEDISESDYISVNLEQALQKKREERRFAGHEYVDLGLLSGILWATCNVGASKPSDYGDYFAWGETSPKKDYGWSNLNYRTIGDSYENVKYSKYVADSKYGTVDNKTRLELSDDAACSNWGGSWRMPTVEEWKELKNNCDWKWTKEDGRCGYKVTGQNGNSIFLPAAGWRIGIFKHSEGVGGAYWSSSLHTDESYGAFLCNFGSDVVNPSEWHGRCVGLSVRPVVSSLQ